MRSLSIAAAISAFVVAACAVQGTAAEHTSSRAQPIINGAASSSDQDFVIQIGLAYAGKIYPTCSGTMVAKNLVLTARHCVGELQDDVTVVDWPATDLHVFVGANAPARIEKGERSDAHGTRLFTAATKDLVPDVALILLDRPVDAPIAAIRLDGGAKKNEILDIVGFGITETNDHPEVRMQRKGVRVLDIGPGRTVYHQIYDGEFVFGEAACSGDSGGPALSATTHAVVGVASRVSNGEERTEQNPSGFCVGTTTEDVYSALAPVKDVVTRAFAAAGAKPILEGTSAPAPAKDAGAPAPATTADEAPPPAPAVSRTTTTTTSGCTAAPSRTASGWTPLAAAIAIALSLRARRARGR